MASTFDESDFVDSDYQSASTPAPAAATQTAVPVVASQKPPTREELESKVGQTQQRLLELKRAQEELERERAGLEEARRRRLELQTGREEIVQNLTRGVGLLEEAEFAARRDAEQMSKSLADLRDALGKVQSIHEEQWSQETLSVELTRALTTIENARMEWNAARLKWTVLTGTAADPETTAKPSLPAALDSLGIAGLCKLGLALTWPLALIGLIGLVITMIFLLRS